MLNLGDRPKCEDSNIHQDLWVHPKTSKVIISISQKKPKKFKMNSYWMLTGKEAALTTPRAKVNIARTELKFMIG